MTSPPAAGAERICPDPCGFVAEGFELGDYVLATKYADGDPGDHFCVGYYAGSYDHYGQTRHLVRDSDGNQFRANGFRRMQKISAARGKWLVEHFGEIEKTMFWTDEHDRRRGRSVWQWARQPMRHAT